MSYGQTVIHYDGTNRGPIYLRDIGQRNGLGGGKGIYTLGQDQYVNYGSDTTLQSTGDVMLSATKGVIKKYSDLGSFSVEVVADSTSV